MRQVICRLDDLIPYQGTAVFIAGEQIALFYVPESEARLFAIQNWDPIGKTYVLSRGIVGDIQGQLCVASPLYKEHYNLQTGHCLEHQEVVLKVWQVTLENGEVNLHLKQEAAA
ncbi:nitrite reductase small subunit NirD [Vibrio mangrovi]|uniref:Nitrite reductase (NADH) small subunit n=1 Tax=Vibrio mangrovi TaxID=474394 RepID=A0A1Y6IMJ6_9VIBR|nr:nitrite reductase small subunit NirD [Vibrio mangrovi]MDW6004333.1 nitrite reductase small subunit NirD [Vibrio mangrovi]SMR98868.1 Nitrite reductase (NADH) small subunit [Vibrio mangrovi]